MQGESEGLTCIYVGLAQAHPKYIFLLIMNTHLGNLVSVDIVYIYKTPQLAFGE